MTWLLAFAAVLFVGALTSGFARRSVFSTAVLFLVAGFVLGEGVLGVLPLQRGDRLVERLADLALFAVLFVDGMLIALPELHRAWRLPGRALLLGMPLAFAITALLAHIAAGLPWLHALLLGAVLAPTDPVFAAAIVGRDEVPLPLRRLLNVESGLNDGLALPLVLGLLAVLGAGDNGLGVLLLEVAAGVALGIALPWFAVRLRPRRGGAVAEDYEPLYVFALGVLVYAIAKLTHANEYLAAFGAGATLATVSPELRESFHPFGERVAELLKLAALLAFGALVSPRFVADLTPGDWVFVAAALLVARPVALALALWRSRLGPRERAAAAWFGPKGFASVVYALLVLHSPLPEGTHLFHLAALVVTASIVAHSSTDVPVVRWLRRVQRQGT